VGKLAGGQIETAGSGDQNHGTNGTQKRQKGPQTPPLKPMDPREIRRLIGMPAMRASLGFAADLFSAGFAGVKSASHRGTISLTRAAQSIVTPRIGPSVLERRS
jgi:hypothetical protein